MIGLVADGNFSGPVVRTLRRRHPEVDIVTVQEVGLGSADDPAVLEWVAAQGRFVVTNDVKTMIRFAKQRVEAGLPTPGIVEAGKRISVRLVVENLHMIATCVSPGEWDGQVIYLPIWPRVGPVSLTVPLHSVATSSGSQ